MNFMTTNFKTAFSIIALGTCSRLMAQSMFDDFSAETGRGVGNDLSAGYSFSSKAEVDHGGKVGEVQIDRYDFNDSAKIPWSNDLALLCGVFWSYDDLGLTGAVPLPHRLEAEGISLGMVRRLSPDWSILALTRVGFAGDSAAVTGSSFDFSGSVIASHKVTADFAWDLGMGATLRGRYGVLPVVGARWAFAPDWTLSVGFPRTALVYRASDRLSWDAGIRFQGGGYRITTAPGAGLGNTYLDYHEFRLGCGVVYRVSDSISAALDGGVALSRRFDYYDRNYTLDGASAGYFRLRVTLRL